VAELADAPDLGSGRRNPVWVQVPPRALKWKGKDKRYKTKEKRLKIKDEGTIN
jgi:hypothetical protein